MTIVFSLFEPFSSLFWLYREKWEISVKTKKVQESVLQKFQTAQAAGEQVIFLTSGHVTKEKNDGHFRN